jgi:hypothetical protein
MRARRSRLHFWHLMGLVAAAGLIAGGYVWLFPADPSANGLTSTFTADVKVGGHWYRLTSSEFWAVLALALTVCLALLAASIAAVVWVVRVIRRRATTGPAR